ncbi:MAG: hypothetical protein WCI02_05315 [Planctomycetota bacterium]
MKKNKKLKYEKTVRLSPYYVSLIDNLVLHTGLKKKSQLIFNAINLAYEVAVESKNTEVVVRNSGLRRQKNLGGVHLFRENWDGQESEELDTSIRLSIPNHLYEKMRLAIASGFADDDSKCIRHALVMLDNVIHHVNEGWEFGRIDSSGTFYPITLALATSSETDLITEEIEELQSLRTYLMRNIELHLTDMLARANLYNGAPEEVAGEFLRAGYAAITDNNLFEQCAGDFNRCLEVLSEFAEGGRAREPSLVVAIEQRNDVSKYLLPVIVRHLTAGVPVYLLHYSEAELRAIAEAVRQDAEAINNVENCFFVNVKQDFFKKNGELIVVHFESNILRAGIQWESQKDSYPDWRLLESRALQEFLHQIEPLIRRNAKPSSRLKSLNELLGSEA